MSTQTTNEVDTTVSEEKREEGLDYVSKSRIKTYKTCPKKFYLKYWCQNSPPSTEPLRKGSHLHETFEVWHERVAEYISMFGQFPDEFWEFIPDWFSLKYLDPFMGNFWSFEQDRLSRANSLDEYVPVSVEEEAWLQNPPSGDIPWMGSADLIVNSSTLPGFDGDGVVILDYKTGSVPDEEYRDEGIYLEQEFYAVLFEEKYDVDGIAAYYPKEDVLLEADLFEERREEVKRTALALQEPPTDDNFPKNEQPLCHYGHGSCYFHNNGCSSRWGFSDGPGPSYDELENESEYDPENGSRYS